MIQADAKNPWLCPLCKKRSSVRHCSNTQCIWQKCVNCKVTWDPDRLSVWYSSGKSITGEVTA